MPPLKIAPSILSSDFGKLNEEIASIEEHADLLHLDIMDGHFVPNITFGPEVIKNIQSSLPLHCHLMISNPEEHIEAFAKAGGDIITFHIEATNEPEKLIELIKNQGVKAGVSLNPATQVDDIMPILDQIDHVLVMSVVPGFGGQSFMDNSLPKIKTIREAFPDLDIDVDGGINDQTAPLVKEAGANVLTAGSYIYKAPDRIEAINKLKSA